MPVAVPLDPRSNYAPSHLDQLANCEGLPRKMTSEPNINPVWGIRPG
jgi:hypothetical protein